MSCDSLSAHKLAQKAGTGPCVLLPWFAVMLVAGGGGGVSHCLVHVLSEGLMRAVWYVSKS